MGGFSGSLPAQAIIFQPTDVGSVPTTVQKKLREIPSAKDVAGDAYGVDDTAVVQALITNEAVRDGHEVLINAGTLTTTGVTLPGTASQQVSLRGDPQTKIKAKAGAINAVLIQLADDQTRTGFRELKSLKINGNSVSGVTGIKSGNTTGPTLQAYLRSVDVRGCAVGADFYSAMENSATDLVCYLNTIGMKLSQDPTNGGGNANRFDGLRLQENTVGLFMFGNSVYPMGGNQFNQPLVQSNTLCGVAMFDVDSGIQFNSAHFEGNGTAGNTLSVDGKTITKCSLQLSNSVAAFNDCTFGETTAVCIVLQNAARISLNNCGGYGNVSGTLISGTLAESVEFYGHLDAVGMVTANVARWPDTISVLSGAFMAIGEVVITPTVGITNDYIASSPTTPLIQNPVGGATINVNVGDAQMGMVSNVTFAASIGSQGANRVTINTCPSGVTSGDTWAVTFLVKASAPTLMNFFITSGSFASFSNCPADTKWRRVVIVFKASVSVAPLMYVYPTNADAPTLSFAKVQSLRVPAGGDLSSISETVALGLFNNNQNTFCYTAAPTVGTWKVGDQIWNTAPAAAGAPGWICTTAGTPGTWKAMASLAA